VRHFDYHKIGVDERRKNAPFKRQNELVEGYLGMI
jgi:hypothetical protein